MEPEELAAELPLWQQVVLVGIRMVPQVLMVLVEHGFWLVVPVVFSIPMVAMAGLAAVAVAMQVQVAVAVIQVAAAVAGPCQDGAVVAALTMVVQVWYLQAVPDREMD